VSKIGPLQVWGLSTSATNTTFCTASDDKTVRVWNANEHTMQLYKKLPKPARSCALYPHLGMHATIITHVLTRSSVGPVPPAHTPCALPF